MRYIALWIGIITLSLPSLVSAESSTPTRAERVFDRAAEDAKALMPTDPAAAIRKATSAEALAGDIGDAGARDNATATAEWLKGEGYLRINQTGKAQSAISHGLAIVARNGSDTELYGNLLLSSGGLHGSKGEVSRSLKDYQSAYDMFRRTGNARSQAKALMLIAALYGDGNDAQSALKYLDQSLDVYSGDPGLVIATYNNRASYLQYLKQYDKAQAQYGMALRISRKMKNSMLTARILGNSAMTSLEAGQVRDAASAVDEAMALASRPDAALARPQLLAIAAKVALHRGDKARAETLINERFAGVDPTKTVMPFRESHEAAYAVFKALGEPQKALIHLTALKRLDDQAAKLATSTNTALMAARFDFANQELKISQLKQDELKRTVAFEQARAQTQRYVFLGSAGAVAIVIGMLTFALVTARRSRDQVRAANDDLAVTNSALGKALAAKTEFLATTSHEIRTPLNGILGMTQVMLADAKLAPDLRDRLGVVHGAGVTMRALVDDILDVAKMETGNLTIETAPFDLCATVTDATRIWEEQARAKGLSFDVDLSACPIMIMGDAARVRQIVFNLLSNALKFTHAGRVGLVVRADGDTLKVDVADSGIGIPAAKLEEIFESFRQADAGTTRQFGGTGLGLSICRNLARAMGGDVTVTSVVGEGATFSLILPFTRAAPVSPAESPASAGATTLIVDRNPITRAMFKTLLNPHSDIVSCVTSIDEAVIRLEEGGVANVLIDDATVRAEGDPLAALRRLTARAGDSATTLLWPGGGDHDALLATGVTRVVAKPVSGAALVAAIFEGSVAKNHANTDLVSQAA